MKKLKIIVLFWLLFSMSVENSPNVFAVPSVEAKKQADVLFQRGTSKYLEGNIHQAVKDLEKVIELDPAHEQARSLLSVILGETASSYYIQGDFVRALPLLEKLKKIFPEDPEINRMYEQASKGAGAVRRSEDVMKFLQKQQQQLMRTQPAKQETQPPKQEVPKKALSIPGEKGVSVPAPAPSSLDAEVNKRVAQIQDELEKKQKKILEEVQSQSEKEKKEFLRKVLIGVGTFSGLLALLFVLLAFLLKRKSEVKRETAQDWEGKSPANIFEESEKDFQEISEESPRAIEPVVPEKTTKKAHSPVSASVQPRSPAELLYKNLCSEMEKIFQLVQNWDSNFGKVAVQSIDRLLFGMKNNKEELFKKSMAPYEDVTKAFFAHCVNVAILACYLKMDEHGQGEPYDKLQQIGLAAALHDVGIAGKLQLISEKRNFNMQDREIVNLHRKSSGWILKNLEQEMGIHRNVSKILLASHDLMVLTDFQELQKGDWEKFPYAEEKDPFVLEMAALVAFVEVLEALTHSRPHREAYSLNEALEILRKNVSKNHLLQKIFDRARQKFLSAELSSASVPPLGAKS